MNKRAVILVSLLSTFVWAGSAYAADTDFSITVNPSLSLSVSSDNVGFSITPSKNGVLIQMALMYMHLQITLPAIH